MSRVIVKHVYDQAPQAGLSQARHSKLARRYAAEQMRPPLKLGLPCDVEPQSGDPVLYFEVRDNGVPMDPTLLEKQ